MYQVTVFGVTYYLAIGIRQKNDEHAIKAIVDRWGVDLDLGTVPAAVRHRASLHMRRLGVGTTG